jgi:dTDP-4-amino-4,6-dideoxygalactose transaminase
MPAMVVPLLDLKAQFRDLEGDIRSAVGRVLASQQFILGEEVAALEREIAQRLPGVSAIGVASGTDALLLALMALEIGEGDEVITTPYTFFATASAIHRAGARPVFVDIDPRTFLIRPDAAARAVTPRTRAVMPVHLFGQMAEMDPLLDLARKRGLAIVEDAAQAVGAWAEVEGRPQPAGAIGQFGCFSFFPSKNLGGAGDGGLVTTPDPALAERIRSLRRHGEEATYVHSRVGLNSRLDALQAAILRAKLPHLERWNAQRERNASRYRSLFEAAGLVGTDSPLVPPEERPGARHTYHQFVIRARRRDELAAHLKAAGIGCAIYYPIPLHLQRCFAHLHHHPGDFPVAETAARSTLALPIYPELTEAMQREVVEAIRRFYRA